MKKYLVTIVLLVLVLIAGEILLFFVGNYKPSGYDPGLTFNPNSNTKSTSYVGLIREDTLPVTIRNSMIIYPVIILAVIMLVSLIFLIRAAVPADKKTAKYILISAGFTAIFPMWLILSTLEIIKQAFVGDSSTAYMAITLIVFVIALIGVLWSLHKVFGRWQKAETIYDALVFFVVLAVISLYIYINFLR